MDGGDDFQVWNYSTELLTSRNGVAGVVFRLSLKNSGYEARQKKKFSSPKCPECLWGVPTLLSNGNGGLFWA